MERKKLINSPKEIIDILWKLKDRFDRSIIYARDLAEKVEKDRVEEPDGTFTDTVATDFNLFSRRFNLVQDMIMTKLLLEEAELTAYVQPALERILDLYLRKKSQKKET